MVGITQTQVADIYEILRKTVTIIVSIGNCLRLYSHNMHIILSLNRLVENYKRDEDGSETSLVPSSNPIIPLASGNSSHTHILPPTVLPSPHPQQSTQTNQTPEVDTNQSFLENLSLFPPL
ncbi:hypothetical protein J6590_063216 [Homalodisca vitripennis]|nr:hypothetical protein J6590_063216 [Homalodisca vitripennis]